jgi:predicted transcriptional regulator
MKEIWINKAFIKIVCAFINTGNYGTQQLDGLLEGVEKSLDAFTQKKKQENTSTHLYDDHFICLKCNHSVILLNKHLKQCHQMTMEEYKTQFNLANDYPTVPKDYSKTRSSIAKKMKLGKQTHKK